MKYLLIIPTYNEAKNVISLIEKILADYANLHILIVDDNSPDQTANLVKKQIDQYPDRLHLESRTGKYGLGSAYQHGFRWAMARDYSHVISMDADWSHNPDDIMHLIKYSNQYDIVLASRKVRGGHIKGWNWTRHLASNGAMLLSRLVLWLETRDVTAGFKCYHHDFVEFLLKQKIKSNGYAFQIETIYLAEKNNFKIKEIPTTFIDRQRGQSKLSAKDAVEFFINVFKLRFNI